MDNSKKVHKYSKWNKSNIKPLIKLYESGMTLREVGEIHNISRERVRQLFESVGYQRRGQTFSALYQEAQKKAAVSRKKILPEAELKRLYLNEKLRVKKIAEIFNVSSETVTRNLVDYGVPLRSKLEAAKLFRVKHPELTKENLYQLYIVENKSLTEIAKMFEYTWINIAKLAAKYGIRKITGEAYEKRYGRLGQHQS